MRSLLLTAVLTFSSLSLQAAEGIESTLRPLIDEVQSESCVKDFDRGHVYLKSLKASDFLGEIKNQGHPASSELLWGLRVEVQKKLRKFYDKDSLSKECSVSARSLLSSLRYAEDMILDHYKKNVPGVNFPDDAFGEGNPHVRKHPQFKNFNMQKDLKSGDIILSRGNAYTSAAISSLGEFDTQFSHLSMVYRDESDALWTVEAHIEVGVFVRPLQEHIEDKNFRSMVLRSDDSELAAKAAKFMFEKARKASDTVGNIMYDFGFDPVDHKQLFCSEVVSYAYDHASGGAFKVPLFPSRLFERKAEFVKMLEIKAAESFIPADLEVDPRFTVIVEWRDAKKIQDVLEKDDVLRTMFAWNQDLHYNLVQASSLNSLIYRNVAWPLRRVPYLKKYFVKKLPLNMSRKLIGYFGVLESTGKLLQKEAKIANEKSYLESGMILQSGEQYKVLDTYRLKDKTARKKKLHKMYRPRK